MKRLTGASLVALALLLAGCGGDGEGNAAAGVNVQAPLAQIPAPNGGDWTQVATRTEEGGFLLGNPDAPVKLVEFASMTCPACRAFAEQANERLRDVYVRSGQVSFEFRNFTLNPLDAAAAVVARCQEPAAFFHLTEQLFAEQPDWLDNLDEAEQAQIAQLPETEQIGAYLRAAELDAFFRQRGIPEARIAQCVGDPANLQRLAQMRERAIEQFQIPGTPTLVVNGEMVNATTWEGLEPILRQRIGG